MQKLSSAVVAALSLVFLSSGASLSAHAGEVTVFGKIDLGLTYAHADGGVADATDTLSMTSGNFLASRFGLKGTEKLTDSTTIGFVLENGFNADSGEMKTSGVLFDRGSWLYVRDRDVGELAAGRIGILRSSAADYSFFLLGARISPFGSGWTAAGSPMYMMPFFGVLKNNTLSYVSPSMQGVKVHLQYAMGDTDENKSTVDRYYGGAVTYDHSAFQLVALVDSVNEKSTGKQNVHDAWTFTAGGNATFGWGKVYAWGQYFKDANTLMGLPGLSSYKPFQGLDRIRGWTASAAASTQVAGGTLMAMASYLSADYRDDVTTEKKAEIGDELDRYAFSVGYRYPLSKSLMLYAAGTWYKDKISLSTNSKTIFHNPRVVQVISGLCYSF